MTWNSPRCDFAALERDLAALKASLDEQPPRIVAIHVRSFDELTTQKTSAIEQHAVSCLGLPVLGVPVRECAYLERNRAVLAFSDGSFQTVTICSSKAPAQRVTAADTNALVAAYETLLEPVTAAGRVRCSVCSAQYQQTSRGLELCTRTVGKVAREFRCGLCSARRAT
ncbi:MAG TPA: hypothetical protein VK524_01380 [Polyangiaceae bacterium]|nr:hypothetical protein [Polyangiaceae bacterium]